MAIDRPSFGHVSLQTWSAVCLKFVCSVRICIVVLELLLICQRTVHVSCAVASLSGKTSHVNSFVRKKRCVGTWMTTQA
ncbi:hypothetical protein CDAR_203921 [Caerostris darwini]|uniref:Secreted protein n=1 Tax=Caerostris darwini TaxID=1538125 RepID=A0AAV4RK48_9ARAC|nr:hypothetical protein CDAR_203921 [Caerostris darwini]